MAPSATDLPRIEVLRALAEPTRHALYRELQRSAEPLTTGELAGRAGLHANTVRAHLDHLCEVGLVRADTARTGGRGRPRHRFSVTGPPPLAETSAGDRLARSLVAVAEEAGVRGDAIRRAGHRSGRDQLAPCSAGPVAAVDAVARHETGDGFDPGVEDLGHGRWRLTFEACPHRQLAHEAPGVVCTLHQGTVEGLCAATGCLEVESFAGTGDARGCHAVLSEVRRV